MLFKSKTVSRLTMKLCKECGIAPVCGSRDLSFRLESSLQVNDAVLFVERTVTVILN